MRWKASKTFFTLHTSVMFGYFTIGMCLYVSSVIFFFLNDNFKSRKKNVLLPEAGSGGFSRLPSGGISPQVPSVARRNQEGAGRTNLGSSCDLEEGTPCLSFLSSAQAAGQLCQVCSLLPEPIPRLPCPASVGCGSPCLLFSRP